MSALYAYIIHVKGSNERKVYMDQIISAHANLTWKYITNGNIEDLNSTILDAHFKGKMHNSTAFTSCAYKHILAMQEGSKHEWFLVVEDDIEFYGHFDEHLKLIIREIKTRDLSNSIISLEDSIPKYIPKSKRKPNQILYSKDEMRLAGAYLMDSLAAQSILQYIHEHKSELTADWLYTHLIKSKVINGFWSQPAIACQKSIDGGLPSLIDNKSTGFFRQINFGIQKWIKKLRAGLK